MVQYLGTALASSRLADVRLCAAGANLLLLPQTHERQLHAKAKSKISSISVLSASVFPRPQNSGLSVRSAVQFCLSSKIPHKISREQGVRGDDEATRRKVSTGRAQHRLLSVATLNSSYGGERNACILYRISSNELAPVPFGHHKYF